MTSLLTADRRKLGGTGTQPLRSWFLGPIGRHRARAEGRGRDGDQPDNTSRQGQETTGCGRVPAAEARPRLGEMSQSAQGIRDVNGGEQQKHEFAEAPLEGGGLWISLRLRSEIGGPQRIGRG